MVQYFPTETGAHSELFSSSEFLLPFGVGVVVVVGCVDLVHVNEDALQKMDHQMQ